MGESRFEGSQVKYAVVIEKGPHNYGAYVPDLPGCVATAKTSELVQRRIEAAIAAHVSLLRERGESVPAPTTIAIYASVA